MSKTHLFTHEQMENSITENEIYNKKYFIWKMNPDNTDIETFFEEEILPDLNETSIALMQQIHFSYEECEDLIDSREWRVLTESEADELASKFAQTMCEDALSEIPRYLIYYFNTEKYIEDILEDKVNLLSSDGEEYVQEVNGTTYYIYKN